MVRASSASSYSCRATTRRAMYSKTSLTPSPVFADVKNRRGYRSGGGRGGVLADGPGGEPDSGVVAVVVPACPRTKRLGVIVGAEDMDDVEGMRRGERPGDARASGSREGEREAGAESAVNAGEESADSNASKSEEEGVW